MGRKRPSGYCPGIAVPGCDGEGVAAPPDLDFPDEHDEDGSRGRRRAHAPGDDRLEARQVVWRAREVFARAPVAFRREAEPEGLGCDGAGGVSGFGAAGLTEVLRSDDLERAHAGVAACGLQSRGGSRELSGCRRRRVRRLARRAMLDQRVLPVRVRDFPSP